mmetsp:Transcript_118250/g.329798  ORF Transcript_118250/g.329798 Transcript_118250/m.329798 type:complete len:207 (+) Transcript_118250:1843-2463(+)
MMQGRTACLQPSDRFRMAPIVSSTRSTPSRSTSTSMSEAREPLPPSTVTHSASLRSRDRRPRHCAEPCAVVGSAAAGCTSFPCTRTREQPKPQFKVSRWTLCSRPPPLPKSMLSAAQPCSFMAPRISWRVNMSMPSPWIRRMYGGSNLWPVGVVLTPNLRPRTSRTSSTMPGNLPLSGRTISTPSRPSISFLRSEPQYCSQARNMS